MSFDEWIKYAVGQGGFALLALASLIANYLQYKDGKAERAAHEQTRVFRFEDMRSLIVPTGKTIADASSALERLITKGTRR